MTTDVDEALEIFNNLTGKNDLSEDFKNMLISLNLTEVEGYIVKLKLNNEILSGKLHKEDVISRLNLVLGNLSLNRTYDNHVYKYNRDTLLFLYNQIDNKVECDNCGSMLLPVDRYCYNCGQEQVPKISILELLSSIDSAYIKPGDIIKINDDNTIEKTTFEENQMNVEENIVEDVELELLYRDKIMKNELNIKYFKVLLLNHIKNHSYINNIDTELCKSYNIKSLSRVIEELMNEKMIKIEPEARIHNGLLNIMTTIGVGDNQRGNNKKRWSYDLTDLGFDYLSNNQYVHVYNNFIKNSVADDIIKFNEIFSKSVLSNYELLFLDYLNIKRKDFLEVNNMLSYLDTYILEAYYYESNHEEDKRIRALFKRFILGINMNFSSVSYDNPIDEEFINYLNNVLTDDSVNLNELKALFNKAYNSIDNKKLTLSMQESLRILFKLFNRYIDDF